MVNNITINGKYNFADCNTKGLATKLQADSCRNYNVNSRRVTETQKECIALNTVTGGVSNLQFTLDLALCY